MFEAHVTQAEPETVAFITMHGPYDQIPQGYQTLYGWVGQHGLQPAGMPHAVYLTPPGAEPEPVWELWAPVTDAADEGPDDSGIGVKHVPEHTVASTVYRGPYEGLPRAYDALTEWIAERGYVLTGPPEELYYSDPETVPPEEYLTEIRFPVTPAQ